MRSLIDQTFLLLLSSLSSLKSRRASALVTVISVTSVVGVLCSLLAVREGTNIFQSARSDEVIVLSRGASNVSQSALSRESVASIVQAPGIKASADGRPHAYAITVVPIDALRKDGKRGTVNLAGYAGGWQRIEGDLTMVAGRMYKPAMHELIVPEPVRTMYRGFELGDQIKLHGSQWTVVGVFVPRDSLADSLLRADAETVMSAFARNTFGQVVVQPESPAGLQEFTDSVLGNPTLSVELSTASEQFEQTFGVMRRLLIFVSLFIGVIMATGAVCGALNSLYASVDNRRSEIATLRALGFNSIAVVASILIESILLALPGAVLGATLAWGLFSGHFVNSGSFVFKLTVTPQLLAAGIGWGLLIGVIGGSLPAIRAVRLPLARALRSG